MPDKPDEEIRKSIKRFEESLPESEHDPDAQEDTERLIERAAQPLLKDEDITHPHASTIHDENDQFTGSMHSYRVRHFDITRARGSGDNHSSFRITQPGFLESIGESW